MGNSAQMSELPICRFVVTASVIPSKARASCFSFLFESFSLAPFSPIPALASQEVIHSLADTNAMGCQ